MKRFLLILIAVICSAVVSCTKESQKDNDLAGTYWVENYLSDSKLYMAIGFYSETECHIFINSRVSSNIKQYSGVYIYDYPNVEITFYTGEEVTTLKGYVDENKSTLCLKEDSWSYYVSYRKDPNYRK